MKSRSLCAQRKTAQRQSLEHSLGIQGLGSGISASDWMFLRPQGCVSAEHGVDSEADLLALGPGDAPSFG